MTQDGGMTEQFQGDGEGRLGFPTKSGGMCKWNQWACITEAATKPVWSGRSEVVERLLAQTCELCGSHEHIEVPHVRKLADLVSKGGTQVPPWKRRMAARQRKSL